MSKKTILSYSEISDFEQCPRAYYYKYVENRAPKVDPPYLKRGITGHNLMQKYSELVLSGVSHEEAKSRMMEGLPKRYRDEEIPHDLVTLWVLLQEHVDSLRETDEIVHVEESFIVPLIEDLNLWIGFTPDIITRHGGNFYTVEDYKFSSKKWSPAKIRQYRQLPAYAIFLRSLGYNVTKLKLTIFIMTKYKPASKFTKVLTPNEAELQSVFRDFTLAALRLKEFKEQSDEYKKGHAYRTLNYLACDFCPFEVPCDLERRGKSAAMTWRNDFTDNTYRYTE